MVFVDSNVFIIDRFFPRDALYEQNRAFIERLGSFEAGISVFTLLEICGAASFRLAASELESWLFRFAADTFGLTGKEAPEWWRAFVAGVSEKVCKKMTLGDALLLREAESYAVQALVTWNTKDFTRRTQLPILSPTIFLRQQERRR